MVSHLINSVACPALFITAPASGQGKTTVTAAIARFHKNAGRRVRVFKTGPDYLDPQVLAQASGYPVEMLDLWMAGLPYCRQKLYEAAISSDLILIEGAMGMFDGVPSSADLAITFGIPIAIVMDVKGMAQTVGAIVHGLANYQKDIQLLGLIANNCGSERHAELIRNSLPEHITLLAALEKNQAVTLPERHLGLVQASECSELLEDCFTHAQAWIESSTLVEIPKAIHFFPETSTQVQPLLSNKTIGIARDEAFSFIYASNLSLLEQLGASLVFFSPLHDSSVPDVDALWLPGGYPELHAKKLSENKTMIQSLQTFFRSKNSILAECGGMLYCMNSLTDLNNTTYAMAGILSGNSNMKGRSGCQGLQEATLPEGVVRAHAHHRAKSTNTMPAITFAKRPNHHAPGENIYRVNELTASYLHLFFPSNPRAIAHLFIPRLRTANEEAFNK